MKTDPIAILPREQPFLQSWLADFTFDRFVVGIMLIVLTTAALATHPHSDTWWLIRSGQLIVEQRRIPTVDPFSSTVAGRYWPNHEWLTEVGFYCLFYLGG